MHFLQNASILVTGGTGSLGKALIHRLLTMNLNLKRLVIFSRDEQKQFQMEQDFSEAQYSEIRYFVGDVRDPGRLKQAFDGIDLVIHTAAMKHIHIAEYNPMECIKTNIIGGQNVITASIEAGVKHVVALSTDKAAAPINLYGATKLASDKLFVASNSLVGNKETKFSVVRYGNVTGSNGSVIPFFIEKKKSGVIPITDPEMTRFSITIDESVDIVIYALENAIGGEIFVPKIASYRITDIAKAIGPECEIEIIGPRVGEKIHEEMITVADSTYTYDIGDYYAIVPANKNFKLDQFLKKHSPKKVEQGFSYKSCDNVDFLNDIEIKELIKSFQ